MTSDSTPGIWNRAYRRWMTLAEGMRRAVAAALFGTVYLTAGLVFAIARLVFMRREQDSETFWRQRPPRTPSAAFFRRMS